MDPMGIESRHLRVVLLVNPSKPYLVYHLNVQWYLSNCINLPIRCVHRSRPWVAAVALRFDYLVNNEMLLMVCESMKYRHIYLAKLWYFTHLGFSERRGFPYKHQHLGWKLVWGRYNLTRISQPQTTLYHLERMDGDRHSHVLVYLASSHLVGLLIWSLRIKASWWFFTNPILKKYVRLMTDKFLIIQEIVKYLSNY